MGLLDLLENEISGVREIVRTKRKIFLEVAEDRKYLIEALVESLDYSRRKFLLSNLVSYFAAGSKKGFFHRHSPARLLDRVHDMYRRNDRVLSYFKGAIFAEEDRFLLTGYATPSMQFKAMFEGAMTQDELAYLWSLLRNSMQDVHVPQRVEDLFSKIYRTNIRRDYLSEPGQLKTPLVLLIGDSRMGKTETLKRALEKTMFDNEVETIEPDFSARGKWRAFFHTSEYYKLKVDPENNRAVQLQISRINPGVVRSKWRGQSASNFSRSFFPPDGIPGLSIIEEAHGVFSPADENWNSTEDETVKTAITAALDKVIAGTNNVITVALTNSPDRITKEIYNRFFQHGVILDMTYDWNGSNNDPTVKKNLMELVRLELRNPSNLSNNAFELDDEKLEAIVAKIPRVFDDRDLKVNPAYVRRLVSLMVERKGDIRPEYFDDSLLVRDGFKEVARNVFGADFYNKIVGKMQRVPWENYIGEIKDELMNRAMGRLYYDSSSKGVVLDGPPGSGKTFLVQCLMSMQPDVIDIRADPSIIFGGENSVAYALESIDKIFSIAKMLSPSLLFLDELDALLPLRNKAGPEDKIVNKFLNEIGGERSFRGVYVVGTTNRLDILDPAVVRSLRLDVLQVNGILHDKGIEKLISSEMKDLDLRGFNKGELRDEIKKTCHTPADIVSLLNTLKQTRDIEEQVSYQLVDILNSHQENERLESLITLNKITVGDVLVSTLVNPSENYVEDIKTNRDKILDILSLRLSNGYSLTKTHLFRAVQTYLQNPNKRVQKSLEDFLAGEISKEPQVGFIMGMAAGGGSGHLVPIASTLLYKTYNQKFVVTGMVSPGESMPDMHAATKMTEQSANEAYSACVNYLNYIASKHGIDIAKVLGERLDGWTIHHQFLNPQYIGGGPSAGYAMLVNTLSLLLDAPVFNDFGITGAPWSKGPTSNDVGSPIIIGGGDLKTYRSLEVLNRMYLPEENLKVIPADYIRSMAESGKLTLPVYNLRTLVPQVLYFNDEQKEKLAELMKLKAGRISGKVLVDDKDISLLENKLSEIAETEITRRIQKMAEKQGAAVAVDYSH